mgnify:CR=1 FL=1
MLHIEDVRANQALNFLDPRIVPYAWDRFHVVRAEQGAVEIGRLLHNMLSSMPMCFNAFGMLRVVSPSARLAFVREVFDREAAAVEMIECEWTPRLAAATLMDKTAFDAVVITRRPNGSRHLVAVETKYTEPFSRYPYGGPGRPDAGRYRTAHDNAGWFDPDAHDALTRPDTNQLWRNCLLAATAVVAGEFDSASVVVVALEDDEHAARAVSGVRSALRNPDACGLIPWGHLVSAGGRVKELAERSSNFDRRYLDLASIL